MIQKQKSEYWILNTKWRNFSQKKEKNSEYEKTYVKWPSENEKLQPK